MEIAVLSSRIIRIFFKILILFYWLVLTSVEAQVYRILNKMELKQTKAPIGSFLSFYVHREKLYIPDVSFGDIKIYKLRNGELLKIIKRKGLGPGEFVEPQYLFVNDKYVLLTGLMKRILYTSDFRVIREYKIIGTRLLLLPDQKIVGNRYHRIKNRLYALFFIDLTGKYLRSFGRIQEKSWSEKGCSRLYPMKYLSANSNYILYAEEWDGKIMVFDLEGNLQIKFRVRKKALPKCSTKLAKLMLGALTKSTLELFARNRKKSPMLVGVWMDHKNRIHMFYYQQSTARFWADIYSKNGKFILSAKIPIPLLKDDGIKYVFWDSRNFYTIVFDSEKENAFLWTFSFSER